MKPIIEQICADVRTEQERELLCIVQSYGFNIDRTRLVAALTDARRFYNEGYEDGQHTSRWISVEERLPEKGDVVLTVWRGEIEFARYTPHRLGWYNLTARYDSPNAVTHWMPLPEPPKEE